MVHQFWVREFFENASKNAQRSSFAYSQQSEQVFDDPNDEEYFRATAKFH